MESFRFCETTHNASQQVVDERHNTVLTALNNGVVDLPTGSTHFGFLYSGTMSFEYDGGKFSLPAGAYFCINGPAKLNALGRGFVVSCCGYHGIFSVGGPIERVGRLRYIDGCTDSLIIPPVLFGDPCLNLLHFPTNINQTRHTHPSARIGMIAAGQGVCVTPDQELPLKPGDIFVIPRSAEHSFRTENDEMLVVAYHPDSDFGPTHTEHPMINRTYVGGVSANKLDSIRTKS